MPISMRASQYLELIPPPQGSYYWSNGQVNWRLSYATINSRRIIHQGIRSVDDNNPQCLLLPAGVDNPPIYLPACTNTKSTHAYLHRSTPTHLHPSPSTQPDPTTTTELLMPVELEQLNAYILEIMELQDRAPRRKTKRSSLPKASTGSCTSMKAWCA